MNPRLYSSPAPTYRDVMIAVPGSAFKQTHANVLVLDSPIESPVGAGLAVMLPVRQNAGLVGPAAVFRVRCAIGSKRGRLW
jgi:hypothetical protein